MRDCVLTSPTLLQLAPERVRGDVSRLLVPCIAFDTRRHASYNRGSELF